MKNDTADTTARNERLKEISRITWLCCERDGFHRSLCPAFKTDEKEKAETLKRIGYASKELKVHALQLNRLERNRCGFSQVLGRNPTELEAVALSLLVAARLDANCAGSVGSVGDVVTLCASRRLDDAALVRSMFRADGSLNKLVVMAGTGMLLDERRAVLKESVFNRILGLTPDPIHELVAQMEWRR